MRMHEIRFVLCRPAFEKANKPTQQHHQAHTEKGLEEVQIILSSSMHISLFRTDFSHIQYKYAVSRKALLNRKFHTSYFTL